MVNGVVAVLGLKVDENDTVLLHGKPVKKEEERICLLVNKPVGITSTTDLKDRHNIIQFVNYPKRLFTIGRLDKDSEGAILLTNDGNYVNALLRSEFEHTKVYEVRVDKPITAEFLSCMAGGVEIFNPVQNISVVTKPCKIMAKGTNLFEITLTQGYNRQIRRMAEQLGYKVTFLRRTKFLFLTLNGLEIGEWRKLSKEEMEKLDRFCCANKH